MWFKKTSLTIKTLNFMKVTKKVTKAELIEILKNWRGARAVSVQYFSDSSLTASGKKAFPELKKIANIGCLIGYNYPNAVNNQREREEKEKDFLSKPLWNGKGKRISLALSTHIEKGTYYLTVKHQQTFRSIFFDFGKLEVKSKSELQDFLKKFTPPTNQGVNEGSEIHHREISVDNIRKIKGIEAGVTYEIV